MSRLDPANPNVYLSRDVEPLIPQNESLWQFLTRCNPDLVKDDKIILQENENRSSTLTYGDARRKAAQGAAGLRSVLGLKEGDMIAVLGSNTINWISAVYAATWAGIQVSAINPLSSAHELVHYLHVSNPTAVLVDASMMAKIHEAQRLDLIGRLNHIKIVSLDRSQPAVPQWPVDFMHSGSAPMLDLNKGDNRKVPAVICFSSGTSGKPKGVKISHHNLIGYMLGIRSSGPESFNSKQVEVFYAPLCHIYGMVTAVMAPAFVGNLVVILSTFNFRDYINVCQEKRATIMRVVPPTAMMMAKDETLRTVDLSSVHTLLCAGAALGEETQAALQQLMKGVNVVQGYGMTEGAITTLKPSHALEKSGSVGVLFPHVHLRLVDDDLHDVAKGQSGEILCYGPTTFMGYKDNAEATAEAFPFNDRWLRTGDIGRMDEDGFLWITDRKKELIKYKGNQVPPAELEDVLMQFPDVAESAVCATWDDTQETEIPVAYVSFKPSVHAKDRAQKLREIRAFVDARVAPYKKLRGGVHYLDVIPKNPTGKILRRNLPARIEMERRAAAAKRKGKL
ncbi:hypothetical protein FE257_010701 [Aspergillus nanangensis]|uniref:Uncharacterized protein n=1 Tax=Aspergillus nanangensis TaxID=2582783 RepID=A0AAD4GRV9_ASPNN|nr:hypothetical protein FE257_010701 [Aspergillus nanangensis]